MKYDLRNFQNFFLKQKWNYLVRDVSLRAGFLVDWACSGLKDKNIPNPFNCIPYIACSNVNPVVMRCSSGLNYDNNKDQCVYPYEYPCHI